LPRDLVAEVKRYHAALDARDFAAVEAMFAADADYVSPGVGGTLSGRASILAAFRRYFAEYADQHATDESVTLVAPNRVTARWRLVATSQATGRTSVRRGEEDVTFDSDGLISRIEVRDL
jgi:ketosteroid isomerase-like protein